MTTTARSLARWAIADALGVPRGAATDCVLCGASPFASVGSAPDCLGVGFSDWHLCDDPGATDLCAGCARLMAGRPGSDPPPLRGKTCAILDGELAFPSPATVWAWLLAPPASLAVLSWAESKQRHHCLSAAWSSSSHLTIGSDRGPIDYRPRRDRSLLEAVATLRTALPTGKPWCTRDEIVAGQYRPQAIGVAPDVWARAEAAICSRRGEPLVPFLVAHAPLAAHDTLIPRTDTMDHPADHAAAALLVALVTDSALRRSDGLVFWSSTLRRRLQRHVHRPLPELVSRLSDELRVPSTSPSATAVLALLARYDDVEATSILVALRQRASLVIALAFAAIKASKKS